MSENLEPSAAVVPNLWQQLFNRGDLMPDTVITVEVGMPTLEELTRIINLWFDAAPLENAYACFQGDQAGADERGDTDNQEDRIERERIMATTERGIGILWLDAARKRADRP